MKRDDTKKNFTSLSGNDLQTVRLHYPSFPCIIAIVPVSRLLNLMRYSSVLNANIRFFCSENRNFTKKGKNVYAILPAYPKNTIKLKDIRSTGKTKISLLGSEKKVNWKQKGDDIVVEMPALYMDDMPCDYAWTLKLENVAD